MSSPLRHLLRHVDPHGRHHEMVVVHEHRGVAARANIRLLELRQKFEVLRHRLAELACRTVVVDDIVGALGNK